MALHNAVYLSFAVVFRFALVGTGKADEAVIHQQIARDPRELGVRRCIVRICRCEPTAAVQTWNVWTTRNITQRKRNTDHRNHSEIVVRSQCGCSRGSRTAVSVLQVCSRYDANRVATAISRRPFHAYCVVAGRYFAQRFGIRGNPPKVLSQDTCEQRSTMSVRS